MKLSIVLLGVFLLAASVFAGTLYQKTNGTREEWVLSNSTYVGQVTGNEVLDATGDLLWIIAIVCIIVFFMVIFIFFLRLLINIVLPFLQQLEGKKPKDLLKYDS